MKKNKIKTFGQNFLKNQAFLKLISQELEIQPTDTIIEIGGGHGELSQYLLKAQYLIVYEIDKNLAQYLKNKFSLPNIEIRNKNFLSANLAKFNHDYKLTGNIPYSITGLIFRKVLNIKNYPRLFVLTLQKEVGEKILTEGEFWYNWLKIWGEIRKIALISKKNFYPQPKVDSLILKIEFYKKPLLSQPEKFVKFLKQLYKNPNRMIKNNIQLPSKFENLANLRPHQLSFSQIKELFNYYS